MSSSSELLAQTIKEREQLWFLLLIKESKTLEELEQKLRAAMSK